MGKWSGREKENNLQPSLRKGKFSPLLFVCLSNCFLPPSLEKHFARKITISSAYFRRQRSNISFTVSQSASAVTITSRNIWIHSEEILTSVVTSRGSWTVEILRLEFLNAVLLVCLEMDLEFVSNTAARFPSLWHNQQTSFKQDLFFGVWSIILKSLILSMTFF